MVKDESVIKTGLTVFACVLIAISFVLFSVGEVRGTYHFHLAPEYVDLIKWIIGGAAGFGAISAAASAAVAIRAASNAPEVEPHE
jgi:uncharacterized membrane protein (DUF4010 family)